MSIECILGNTPKRVVTSSKVLYEEMKILLGDKIAEKEFFCTVTVNLQNEIIKSEIIHIGTINQSLVHPREVFRPALMSKADGMYIIHNHPSGTLSASRADMQITNRLVNVGKELGITVVDHVIVTRDGYYSFNDNDLIHI